MADAAGTGTSLQQAIKNKYCAKDDTPERGAGHLRSKSFEVGLAYRPGVCPVQKLKSIVLDYSKVDKVEEPEDGSLAKLCPSVEEMHLCNNSITHWNDVVAILSSLPTMKLLNLGHNPLASSTFLATPSSVQCGHLSTLVLNGTKIEWSALETFLKAVPLLQELHLSMNGYSTVDFRETFKHEGLKNLHFNDNQIEQWDEMAKLSSAFPNLQRLIAASNPIAAVPNDLDTSRVFTELLVLNFNNSSLSEWDSIESLQTLQKLQDLSLLKIPLSQQMEVGKRRKAFVARLPNLNKLNKTPITDSEREMAERWLIRELRGVPNPPTIYQELVKKHGNLQPLADINLAPVNTISMDFRFVGMAKDTKSLEVQLNQTVLEFRKWVGQTVLAVPESSFQLFYVNKEDVVEDMVDRVHEEVIYIHRVCLKNNNKKLYAYRMSEGDEIHIEMKIPS